MIFIVQLRGGSYGTVGDLSLDQLLALSAVIVNCLLGFVFSLVYMRLFRRTPSLSVFFVTWFFLLMSFDASKIGQILLPVSPWPQFAPVVARVTIFGHIIGVVSLFGAGLYAGGVRMQRHGTAMFVVAMIALALSASIPIDTSSLPPHLVYEAGMRSSLQATLVLLLVVAVVNYVQAAVGKQDYRQLMSALAVALVAAGREMLFYFIEPLWLVAGAAALVVGGVLFAAQNYRDFLVPELRRHE
ncbi:MAG: hypothetical protein MI724_08455 [Spirochaetales bacterium]|nr:hypothetical protein [Spirochaetales bacterium]